MMEFRFCSEKALQSHEALLQFGAEKRACTGGVTGGPDRRPGHRRDRMGAVWFRDSPVGFPRRLILDWHVTKKRPREGNWWALFMIGPFDTVGQEGSAAALATATHAASAAERHQ
ncbi:hypothetical protein P8631_06495 [Guyparkeria sp. 1SP6A2]|nr:hypothetical protein [Guyparkeria sp. 1SP6A2]